MSVGSELMLVCSACGRENPGDSRFCSGCGVGLSAPTVERRKLVTSVFCDLSGSTALGEAADSEIVFALMRSYFDHARAALERHGGAVEKFIGDAVVGMFGVPEAHEDDALRACRAALEIQERIAKLNVELEARYGSGIAVRVGVNSGEVVTGESARREMFASGDAVVLGDSVNVAARLEQAAAPGEVLIGEATYRLVRDAVMVEPVEPLLVKGKTDPVGAFRLVGLSARGPLPRRMETQLVGRESELADLVGEFEAAAADRRCRLVTVVGEPGVGKSRLAAELIDRLGLLARVVRGGCLSYGEGITYWAVAQVVRELAGIGSEQSLEGARAQLESFLAQAPDGVAVAKQMLLLLGIGKGSTTPEELAWATRRLLATAAVADERPLLVVFDDIQWAEPALLDLLESLPALSGDAPLLVVCLARPELAEVRPAWAVSLRLEPLNAAAIDALLEELGAPATMRVRIAHIAAGNPLFAEELVAWVGEGGGLGEMPTSLNALLGARLDRLDAEARATLERGAVEGELFHEAAIVELSEEALRPSVPGELGTLARKDLIRLAAASLVMGGVAYRFKHILVREAAYLAMTKKLRGSLHERFADWLERFAGDRVGEYSEIIGYHLERAFRYRSELGPLDAETRALGERSSAHLVDAAGRAGARSDFEAVANLLERSLAVGITDPRQRVRVQLELGKALHQTRRVEKAETVLTETSELAARLGEDGVAARALVQRLWNRTGDPSFDPVEAQAISERAITTLTEAGDDSGLVLARRMLANMLGSHGQTPAVGAEYERALANAARCDDREMRRLALGSFASGYLCAGPTPAAEAIVRCEELLESVRGDRILEATVMRPLALFYAMSERQNEALELLSQANLVLDELNLRTAQVYRHVVAYARELTGDRNGAENELRTMWTYFRNLRVNDVDTRAVRTATVLARLYCDSGRWDEADEMLHYGRSLDKSTEHNPRRLAVAARLSARQGQDDAVQLAEQALALSEPQTDNLTLRAEIWVAHAAVHRSLGLTDDADLSVARALELYERKGNTAARMMLTAA
jgi:class 3 adenylate cyclase/tetratricopeptide (TPR) repeat protein